MSLNLVSPGVKVREVDLTIGRIDPANDQVGSIAGPFAKGPVNVPVLIETEQDLLNTFGKPSNLDGQYEYWLSASSYLSYGGTLRVIRTDDNSLINAHAGVSSAISLKIKSAEDYSNNYSNSTDWLYAAREPGSWANGIKVCTIDAAADQRIAIGTFGLAVGFAMTCGFSTSYAKSDGSIGTFFGYVKSIITKVNEGSVDIKILSNNDNGVSSPVTYGENPISKFLVSPNVYLQAFNSVGTANSLEKLRIENSCSVGVGSTVIEVSTSPAPGVSGGIDANILVGDLIRSLNQSFSARVTGIGTNTISLATGAQVSLASTTLVVTYTRSATDGTLARGEGLVPNAEKNSEVDWYDQQTLGLTNSTIYWKSIAPRPGTSQYSSERSGKNDEVHVVVVDDSGSLTGIAGNILEKNANLSKAVDGKVSPSESNYYKSYIANSSAYIFAGVSDSLLAPKFTTIDGYTPLTGGAIQWNQNAASVTFGLAGAKTYPLSAGSNYGASSGYNATLSNIISSYDILSNPAEYSINYLISGPSGGATLFESQAKANKLISIAEARKDCIAVLSPHKSSVVNVTNTDSQTQNIINYFNAIGSSSYAVFDSGYKYTFDRFNNEFRYVPLNADIAGLMARTSINSYPWYSPAGSARGSINNAIKLAYNPSQAQRDLLYPKRINPVIFSPGAGIVLFGDKTALSYASAFDRINVRRLFLTIEDTISRAARAQLFEFNDVITRTNFVNIVEPYLRDVKAKRGITDFLVVCDESNNTPDVIDANQFRADIFVKPARSINFIGLTFVANRTGVSFEEVVGTV